ncbi:unnamed protein product [Cuscuta epithymum]|uniref:Pyruvate phosphate dikinase AMP/ATP-binding domain-containing protein n=1 Tax=Cuscuta epithymum TaxID=186058 RepID=A0AAV0DQY4_9ASTE|nr:unnamed protein product [Cuscuta epithymum]
MSNTFGSNLLQARFHSSGVSVYHRRISSPPYFGGSSLFESQVNSLLRKSPLLNELRVKRFPLQKGKFPMAHQPSVSCSLKAMFAADPSSENSQKFKLERNMELQVDIKAPMSGHVLIDYKVPRSASGLFLHWGAIKPGNDKWILPGCRPNGSTVYKNKALRSPFMQQAGPDSVVTLDIDDPAIQAIEFVIYHKPHNKWIKNRGKNFHIKLPQRKPQSNLSVPEDLVKIQAYLRWERKGKQTYKPQQEKDEYEAARTELLEEISRGTSIVDIRARLTKKNDTHKLKEQALGQGKGGIPTELVQTQAFIRQEKAGKPIYSSVEQLKQFEEARKGLQLEHEKGISLDELRKKNFEGEIQANSLKQVEQENYFNMEKIQRKKRDLSQLINKKASGGTTEVLSAIDLFAKSKEGQTDGPIVTKKIYNISNNKLLVLVAKDLGKTKVYLATDLNEPVILHWALSRKPGEWLPPPPNMLPYGSISSQSYAETPFSSSSSDSLLHKVQSLEILVEGGEFTGMPFVLLSGRTWIKDTGSDFYVDFITQPVEDGRGVAKALLDKIANKEREAQKSFMHRFNIAADLTTDALNAGELGFAAILVWMRFMATRQLIWNKNYNVKPREISRSQDRLTDMLLNVYINFPQYRELLRMIMSAVGRGGEGDVGQRIRDEILVIQRKNDCKGGMMEEWHQKLHNNTSPDDVVICQALIDYISSDFDISVYWKTLNSNGITKERLLSYDRAIHSEPKFRRDQKEGLLRDLGSYMRTLKAVHSGADLESAIGNCIGYKAEGEGFMVGVQIKPVSGLPSRLPELLKFILNHVEDKKVEALLEGLLEAREELRPLLSQPNNRLKDLLFLDIALDSTVRTAVERGYEELSTSNAEKIIYFITLVIENLALSMDDNEDLVYCLKGWNHGLSMMRRGNHSWALFAKSVLDRTRLALSSKAQWYHHLLQPSAEYLGTKLGVNPLAVNIFTEEIIRAGSAASLSSLINRLDPVLRQTANLGSWQVISPVEAVGYIVFVDDLLSVQHKSYKEPTILVAKTVKGEEEIPDGATAVLTPDMPDVLSHVSVRARNGKVCFATCFDPHVLADLRAKEGRILSIRPRSGDIIYSEVEEVELVRTIHIEGDDHSHALRLVKKHFAGRYAIASQEFTSELVGAKSRNIANLKIRVPSWIGIPTSVALPFGAFEQVLSDIVNKDVATKLLVLKKRLSAGEFSVLGEIRKAVLELSAPSQLVNELKDKMQSSGMPWPGDESPKRWEQAWVAIKKVWASKWNERAYISTRKVKLDHDCLCMAVLVQQIINADYAFVIHTTNPSSGDASEIYAEVVKGLGETLVGAYPGRAMSFSCKKNDLNSPQVLGYPSKPTGLFIRPSIIFRSDSNGEDLEGYAGAGLYDSVPVDEAEKVILDYSCDPLITDPDFRQSVLSKIASAGSVIEELYGHAQDIEGVVKDGNVFVVQTRPQM